MIVPARPIRSSARRISGAKITGMASSMAGTEFRTSHENAGRSTRLVTRISTTTIRITPRSKHHGLRIAQPVHQAKEDQRDHQDVDDAEPVETLEYEEQVVQEFGHV